MAFTDRFISIPIIVFDILEQELTDKPENECSSFQTFRKINPMRIESYQPAIPRDLDFDKSNLTTTSIIMYSGERVMAFMTCEELEELPNKFGNT